MNEDGIGAFVNGDLIVSVAGVQPAMNTFGLWTDDNDSGIAYDNVKVETTSKIVIEESNDLNLDNKKFLDSIIKLSFVIIILLCPIFY